MTWLDDLPTELLFRIARCIGSQVLRDNIDMQLLCKRWYNVANVIAFEELSLGFDQLDRLFQRAFDPSLTGLLASVKHFRCKYKPSWTLDTPAVSFSDKRRKIGGTEPWELVIKCPSLLNTLPWRSGGHRHPDPMLQRAAGVISRSTQLRTLFVTSCLTFPHQRFELRAWERSVDVLLGALPNTLTDLTLNLVSEYNDPPIDSNGAQEALHSCADLLAAGRMPHLRHVRLHLPSVCPELFLTIDPSTRANLETLIVVVPALGRFPPHGAVRRSAAFQHLEVNALTNGQDRAWDMVRTAEAVAPHLPALTKFWIIEIQIIDDHTYKYGSHGSVILYDVIHRRSTSVSSLTHKHHGRHEVVRWKQNHPPFEADYGRMAQKD